ncbi:MAG: caspase family protein [Gemmatimonadetes bacterium]|nr:caspase family protein [Gemmatimonadota bacterium]MDA1103556.1 caspase family protein [Gemmatimonadota bacterium]
MLSSLRVSRFSIVISGVLLLGAVPTESAPAAGRKIALIIAISDYGTPPAHPETGEPLRPYRDLNAKNDVPLVRGALEAQGFTSENIRVIEDADADAEGIRDAFRWLVRETGSGDVVVLHYSGDRRGRGRYANG